MPAVPKLPPGYYGTKKEQQAFLNKVKARSTTPYNLALIHNKNLSEGSYYAEELGNKNSVLRIQSEQLRRVVPPFRTIEPSRPNMPLAATDRDGPTKLIRTIYGFKSPAEQAKAYHDFIDIYLTDWVDRKGFVNTDGQRKYYQPYANDGGYLTQLEGQIEKILKESMLEKPNPGTLNKRPGNSLRQQYLKDILGKIKIRRQRLMNETFNKLTKQNREASSTRIPRGGRRTHKRKYTKRRYTRRN